MKNCSPLRYPGGKSVMSGLLSQIRRINMLGGHAIAEPFAGGAGASLTLLFLEETQDIYINDADPSIYNFWWSVLNRTKVFNKMISECQLTIPVWCQQRKIYLNHRNASKVQHGFSTFYLNRCNRSGIINGGPIGGKNQKGKWKINARFNKVDLINRCKKIAEYRDRIHLSFKDGIDFINSINLRSVFLFIDPPYYYKGKTLYLNTSDNKYHSMLAEKLKSLEHEPWVLTYDDCLEIRKLYRGWAKIKEFSLRYSAADRRIGREILITPKWMYLPRTQTSMAISW